MRILFIADGRSPIAANWIRHFSQRGDEVYLASTFDFDTDISLRGFEITPVAFSVMKKKETQPAANNARTLRLESLLPLDMRNLIRHLLGPITIPRASRKLRAYIEQIQPDMIHAMRVPYEGMLAAEALGQKRSAAPLIVSIWGNDFTLHAPSTPLMKFYTRRVMQTIDALHADCHRDIRIARDWGFDSTKPTLVTPGNGGIRTDIFYPPQTPVDEPIIINPRGLRAYVRNDMFFKAIPLVLQKFPNAKFICASMEGKPQVTQWIRELNIAHAVETLAPMPHAQMADVFRRAQIVVSPGFHDGTPNSLLEGMACGCFPVAGDLESIREWITPNENGMLFDCANPHSIADAIVHAMENKSLRQKAAGLNGKIVLERAEYQRNMETAQGWYETLIHRR